MNILYFASIREKIGRGEEFLSPPADVSDVARLIDWLKRRGPDYDRAFGDMRAVRVAVNQEHVKLDHPVAADDEVAFFPPVTGG
jgi:sulfur-carrier protein